MIDREAVTQQQLDTPDREATRSALAWWDSDARYRPEHMLQGFDALVAAARAWLDQGDALVIRRDLEPEFGHELVWVLSEAAMEAAISERHRNQRPKCYESLDDDGCYCRATTQAAVVNFLDALSDRSDK